MDKELKRKWIEALRSGRYEQTQNHLKDAHGYCCLGVLCDVAGIELAPPTPAGIQNSCAGLSEREDQYAPIYNALGKSSIAPHLWRMNDGNGQDNPKTFSEIADYIDREL